MKKILHYIILIIFSIISGTVFLHAQLSQETLSEKFNQYAQRSLQEKLYMHVDRNFYLAGEILWFRIYVTDAMLHQPLDMSKVAYAELIDAANTPVLQAKISLTEGKGNGSFALPVSLNSGHYKIRGYTNWMKNTGADYFFEQNITIVNTQKNREAAAAANPKNNEPDIRFFPEGGSLVAGLSSRMACKIVGADGKGIAFSGKIIDEQQKPVADFHSYKMGMGSFDFTPAAGHRYQAAITIADKTFTQNLPTIFEKGYVLHLDNSNASAIRVEIQTNLAGVSKVWLLAHTRQSLKEAKMVTLENGKASVSINPEKLGEGISHITLFTAEGQPVCERLYFRFPQKELSIQLNGLQASYPTRSKVDFTLGTSVSGQPENNADLSMAVYKLDELQLQNEDDIRSYLWLRSDLKGYIESPGYYFSAGRDEASVAMDNLMLTQGWRRFSWDDILHDKMPPVNFAPELNGHIISGKVVSTVTGKPLENIETYVSVPGLNANFRTYISDAEGRLKFDFTSMKGSSEIIVQTNPNAADTLSRVELANPFLDQYSSIKLPPFSLLSQKQHLLQDLHTGVQVQNAYHGLQLKRFWQSADTAVLFEKPDAVYMMDDYTRFTTVEEVLREYVTLMDVQKRRSGFSIQLWNNFFTPGIDLVNRQFFQTEPLILVNSVPVFNVNRLMGYDPLKMRKLEVYNRRYFLGNSFFSGILNFTSYKGDLADFELDPRALVVDYEGLQLQREFYSPVYDGNEDLSHLPDFRTLLYWAHEIKADKKGDKHISFYTSDKKGKYVAVIQGLTAKGNCGSRYSFFEVQ